MIASLCFYSHAIGEALFNGKSLFPVLVSTTQKNIRVHASEIFHAYLTWLDWLDDVEIATEAKDILASNYLNAHRFTL